MFAKYLRWLSSLNLKRHTKARGTSGPQSLRCLYDDVILLKCKQAHNARHAKKDTQEIREPRDHKTPV